MAKFDNVTLLYDQLPLRQRVILLIAFLSVIYLAWFLIIDLNINKEIDSIKSELLYLNQKNIDSSDQLSTISNIDINILQDELNDIVDNTKKLDQYLNHYFSIIVSSDQIVHVVNDILSVKSTVVVDAVELLPVETLPLETGENRSLSQRSDVYLYKQGIAITVHGRYFDIQNYLASIEKLEWQLFFEHLLYEVEDYPEAKLSVKLYVFSTKNGVDFG